MQIEVELYGQLWPNIQRRQNLSLKKEMRVAEVAAIVGIEINEIGMIVIDGVQSRPDDLVKPGCRLCFFPPMTGG